MIERRAFLRRMAFAALALGVVERFQLPKLGGQVREAYLTVNGVRMDAIEEGLNGWIRYGAMVPAIEPGPAIPYGGRIAQRSVSLWARIRHNASGLPIVWKNGDPATIELAPAQTEIEVSE